MVCIVRLKAAFKSNSSYINRLNRQHPPYLANTRSYSTTPPTPPTSRIRSRLQNLNNRLPRFLQSYTTPLLNAPVRHITSFMILHELTAVVPLAVLVSVFHYGEWIPSLGNGDGNSKVDEGVRKFGKWLRKRGWAEPDVQDASPELSTSDTGPGPGSNRGMRLILEFATAYAITKALIPVRVMVSVWATPWFARTVLTPFGRAFTRIREILRRR